MRQAEQQEYIEYLTGKTIAVVGNASSIGQDGAEIDRHDVVIRFNNFRIIGLEDRVGTKTHVWAHCHNKGLSDNPRPRTDHFDFQWYSQPIAVMNILEYKVLNPAPFFVCSEEYYNNLSCHRHKILPSTGNIVLNWLYDHGFQFDCYGFDQFVTPNLEGIIGAWHNTEFERAEFHRLHNNKEIEAVLIFRDEPDRRESLNFTLEWCLRQFGKVHLECINRASTFNKSRMHNRGLSHVNPKSLVAFVDSDTFVEDDVLRQAIAQARKTRGLVYPFTQFLDLNQESTRKLIKTKSLSGCSGQSYRNGVGKYLILPAAMAFTIGGWDEEFVEWGGEDEAFYAKAKLLSQPTRIDATCYHLWHPPNLHRPNKELIANFEPSLPKPQAMKISIIVPTRGRVNRFRDMYRSALGQATYRENLEFCLYLDWDDDESIEKLGKRKLPQTKVMVGDRIKQSAMWNNAATLATGNILMQCADDAVFRTKGWDQLVINAFEQYPDRIALVYGDDGFQGKALATLGFIHRRWYETVGYFVPPIFTAMWSDTWLTHIAQILKRDHYIPELKIEHLHPDAGKGFWDATYQYRQETLGNAGEVFASTKQLRVADAHKLQRVIREKGN